VQRIRGRHATTNLMKETNCRIVHAEQSLVHNDTLAAIVQGVKRKLSLGANASEDKWRYRVGPTRGWVEGLRRMAFAQAAESKPGFHWIENTICDCARLGVGLWFMVSHVQKAAQNCCRCTRAGCASFGEGKLGM
jgi:hypothetical protein